MLRRLAMTVGTLAVLALGPAAEAQNPQPAPPGQTPPAVTPPGPTATPPEKIAPRGGNSAAGSSAGGNSTLSDRLSRSQGTVQPPAVDPGITMPPPAHGTGTMPVIPPPGTPGGNQAVVPK